MVEKKEDNKLESVEHEDQPKKVEAPFPLIDSSFLEEGIDSYKSLFEENLVEGLARQCNDLNGYNTCPLANVDAPCPFGSNKTCPEITADDWRKLELYVEEKEIQDINNQSEAPDPLIHSCVIDEYLQSYKLLLENTTPFGFARQCSDVRRTARCPLENEEAPCPFGSNRSCSEIIEEDWKKLAMYVKEKEEVNMQREAHTQAYNTQEDIAQETKESPVRCYYAFMVKEEKIVFYKGVFTRSKTVPVAFTAESQRDLFVRNYECSYAVSRRQLLHELADAYQDRSITELSRVISEIRRRAISATENSNGAITYSDYLYFDMAEIVFDI